jgi:hypothetical protein
MRAVYDPARVRLSPNPEPIMARPRAERNSASGRRSPERSALNRTSIAGTNSPPWRTRLLAGVSLTVTCHTARCLRIGETSIAKPIAIMPRPSVWLQGKLTPPNYAVMSRPDQLLPSDNAQSGIRPRTGHLELHASQTHSALLVPEAPGDHLQRPTDTVPPRANSPLNSGGPGLS